MKNINISISEIEFNKFRLKSTPLSFSELLDLVSRELTRQKLSESLRLSEESGLSSMTASDSRIRVSHAVYQEYSSVLQRPKFARFPDFFSNAQLILSELERIAIFYNPRARVDLLKDLDDNRFLELAKSSKAHFLITGNHRDFDITEFHGTQIVNMRDYFQNHMLR